MSYVGRHRECFCSSLAVNATNNYHAPGYTISIHPYLVSDWQAELDDIAFIDDRLDPYTANVPEHSVEWVAWLERLGTGFDRERDGATAASPLSQ